MVEKNSLILGDCLEVMKDIPNNSVDLVLCDLPYGMLNKSNPRAKWDSQIPLEPLWEEYKRISKPNAAILLFGTGLFTADLMVSNRNMFRYNLVWDKVNPTNHLNSNHMPMPRHEIISVFYKKRPVYHPQMTPYDSKLRHGVGTKCFSRKSTDNSSCYGAYNRTPTVMSDKKYPTDIISIKRKHNTKQAFHPTEKPVELLRWLIRTYSNKGDVVLDNTMGSGSTCVAAVLENRNFIGIEKEEEYFLIAKERVKNAMETSESTEQSIKSFENRKGNKQQEEMKMSVEQLNLASAYAKYQIPQDAGVEKVQLGKNKDGKWEISASGSFGKTEKKVLSAQDTYSLFHTKTATREQLAAKYFFDGFKAAPEQKIVKSRSMGIK